MKAVFNESAGLTPKEEILAVGAGAWMVVGLFLDGLAHVELEPESFFTVWHLVLYSGFGVAVLAGLRPVARRHVNGPLVTAIPPGHGVTLVGIALFGLGAILDLVWHETLGIEVSNEALLSPTHLLLLVGAIMTLSGPLRHGWATLGPDSPRRAWWPAAGALALVTSVAIFFTSYLTPFGLQSAASYPSTTTHTHELDELNLEVLGQLREVWGLAGIITTTTILSVTLLLLLKVGKPPTGVITGLSIWLALALPALGQFRQWQVVPAVALAGVLTDRTARWVASPAIITSTFVGITWTGYFVGLAARSRLEWSPALWSGSIVLATLIAAALGLVATPHRAARAGLEHGAPPTTASSTPTTSRSPSRKQSTFASQQRQAPP